MKQVIPVVIGFGANAVLNAVVRCVKRKRSGKAIGPKLKQLLANVNEAFELGMEERGSAQGRGVSSGSTAEETDQQLEAPVVRDVAPASVTTPPSAAQCAHGEEVKPSSPPPSSATQPPIPTPSIPPPPTPTTPVVVLSDPVAQSAVEPEEGKPSSPPPSPMTASAPSTPVVVSRASSTAQP
ncbi:MAG: hypothetical protein AAGJ35_14870, partial [Myxococcota bacterium]